MKTFFTPKDRQAWTPKQLYRIHLATLTRQVFYNRIDNTYYLSKYHDRVIIKKHYSKYKVIDVTRERGFYLGIYPKHIAGAVAKVLNRVDWWQMDKYILQSRGCIQHWYSRCGTFSMNGYS